MIRRTFLLHKDWQEDEKKYGETNEEFEMYCYGKVLNGGMPDRNS